MEAVSFMMLMMVMTTQHQHDRIRPVLSIDIDRVGSLRIQHRCHTTNIIFVILQHLFS